METVRHSVFETNSSSTHSISIASGDYVPDIIYVDEEGICRIYPGEFGWEVESYYDAPTKASYCLTYVKTGGGEDNEALLVRVLKEVTGAKEIQFEKTDFDYHEWGYIDHQSHVGEGDACGKAFKSEQSLKDFIFNKKSELHTDNDNG